MNPERTCYCDDLLKLGCDIHISFPVLDRAWCFIGTGMEGVADQKATGLPSSSFLPDKHFT